jgi:hypothetical protein
VLHPAIPSRSLLALPCALAVACTTAGRSLPYPTANALPVEAGRVITTLDMLASGEHAVAEYLASLPDAERARYERAVAVGERACVRIDVRHGFVGMSFSLDSGSGVMVADDRGVFVASAGHTFTNAPDARATVATTASVEIDAKMAACRFEDGDDYAVMNIAAADVGPAALPRPAEPRVGERIVALGYPDTCGRAPDGRIMLLTPDLGRSLAPLKTVLEVAGVDPLRLVPVAGAMPLHGFSGGGLFNLDGDVIGVLTGSEWQSGADARHVLVTGHALNRMPRPQ